MFKMYGILYVAVIMFHYGAMVFTSHLNQRNIIPVKAVVTVMKPKNKKRRKRVSVLDAKNNRVEEVVTNLRQKHGTRYTTVQYRLWAEMVDVGTHK